MSEKKNVPAIILSKFEVSGKDGEANGVMHGVLFGDLNSDSEKVLSGKVSQKVEFTGDPKETAELQRKQEAVAFIKLFKQAEDDSEFRTKFTGSVYIVTDEKDDDGHAITQNLAYVSLIKADNIPNADYSVSIVRVENAERASELKKALKEADDESKEEILEELNSISTSGFANVTKVGSDIVAKMTVAARPEAKASAPAKSASKGI